MKAVKIIVLESSDSSISQIIEILRNNGFYVDICSNNNEFLECIYNNLYDLYLININEKSLPRFQLIQLSATQGTLNANFCSFMQDKQVCSACIRRALDRNRR